MNQPTISYCLRFLLISLGLAAGTAQAAPANNVDGFRTGTTNTMANGGNNGAFGTSNTLTSKSLAVGQSNTASNSSFAVGLSNLAGTTNNTSLLAGENNEIQYQTNSVALGADNQMIFPSGKIGGANILLGKSNKIDATGNVGAGLREIVLIGTLNEAAESNAYVFGTGNIGQNGVVTLGTYANTVSNASLIVGNGTNVSNVITRSNALVVLRNGDTSIQGSLTVGGSPVVTPAYLTTNNYLKKATGSGATAASGALLAIGSSASAGGSGSVALGASASSAGIDSFAFGYSSYASGANSVAWGNDASASGAGAIAFGSYSVADGTSSIAFGDGSQTTNWASVALGAGANARGDGTTAIGAGAYAELEGAAALGNNAWATKESSVALGYGAAASAISAVAIGNNANASSVNSIVIGEYASDMGANTTVIGGGNTTATYVHGEANLESLDVGDASVLGGQVTVEKATSPGINGLRVLADGTVLVKKGGDLSMGTFTSGTQP